MFRLSSLTAAAALCTTLFLPHQLAAQGVTCKDGTTASQTGRGACSHHGGVSAAVATVSCKDGSTADAGRGACSHHGGVKRATTRSKRSSTKVSRASHEETTAPVADAGSSAETVSCRDGTSASAGRGACSHHGGVGSSSSATTTREPSVRYAKTSSSGNVACQDGTTSTAGRGACSHHGGVAASERDQPSTSAPIRSGSPGNATALCNDGTYSESARHTGTCSHHGGVKEWL